MAAESVLIVGCGDVGIATASLLVERGYRVTGLRRNPAELPEFIEPLAADICKPASLSVLQQRHFSWVLVTTSAGGYSEERYRAVYVDGLRNILQRLEMRIPKGLLLASSTSVYHQQDGSWVDETSATRPGSFAGRIQLEAEALALASQIPCSVVRFAGIYGPGRERLLSRLRQGYIVASDSQNYSNRVHSRDCAGILAHLLAMKQRGVATESHYLAVDCAPTPLRAVCEWLASNIGLDPANLQEDATLMRGGNKRCSNRRLLRTGYRFVYPDYQAGFGAILKSGINQAP